MTSEVHLFASGDQCLIVEFGHSVDIGINRQVCAFAQRVRLASLPFIIDVVPAFSSVGIHYLPFAVPRSEQVSPYAALCGLIEGLLLEPHESTAGPTRLVEIPVCYGGEYGPDLDEVARASDQSPKTIVALHVATDAHVFMIGFAPGHPYIGLWDERFAVPRRLTPRTQVPAGSVAIANRQCVIYPFDLPGGWNVIGRTPLTMFEVSRAQPCLLQPGDLVRFVEISPTQYEDAKRGAI